MRSTRRIFIPKCKFDPQEDDLLTETEIKLGPGDWNQIASEVEIPGRNTRQCPEHWGNFVNPVLIKTEWTREDELLLQNYRELGGTNGRRSRDFWWALKEKHEKSILPTPK
jgi:hypothetical protein